MTKLTNDQIERLNGHLAPRVSSYGIVLGELWVRTKGGNLKKGQKIATIRRELVAWLRDTVRFTDGELFIHAKEIVGNDERISYPLIAKLLGFTDHTSALLAHRKWKRENETDPNVTGDITPEEVERGKAEVRACAPRV